MIVIIPGMRKLLYSPWQALSIPSALTPSGPLKKTLPSLRFSPYCVWVPRISKILCSPQKTPSRALEPCPIACRRPLLSDSVKSKSQDGFLAVLPVHASVCKPFKSQSLQLSRAYKRLKRYTFEFFMVATQVFAGKFCLAPL